MYYGPVWIALYLKVNWFTLYNTIYVVRYYIIYTIFFALLLL